ncbi:ROK family glucokinase [Bacillus sp. ISL-40]|uniref:ROK family glucokinase n=1 Tax=unclassified Bacillus (in: firmicutes) TaxID=185979 RepID=UPI001BE5A072|nr:MULTISPECIES: ROK family glucokinase [unclassified Bacillus (in: firmicutes)]MBT2701544.1 ROK family glucokinase [Bacillus sp. ISL-40]MBT2725029.1 ROK family glucokinase [Bacillus sp. ISL-46]MBT2743694.1 ROK family glucokinase [Bacillus sp. ISL-77]
MSRKWIVGVDLGGTTTKLAFVTTEGEIVHKWEIPTDNTNEGQNITGNIAKAIDEKLAEHDQLKSNLLGIGMGAPGPVNYEKGIVLNVVNLGWPDNYPLKDRLEAATSLPAAIENDANSAALGEMWMGAGAGAKDLVCVTLGTGVGGGVIVGGKVVQGINGAAGEIGHITAIPSGGAPCNCGKTGCLETVASATGIVRLAKVELAKGLKGELSEKLAENGSITAKDVFDAARNSDELAKSILDEVSFHLGFVLASIANTLNPEKIVLGGGVSKAGDILVDPVKNNFEKFAFSPVRDSTKLALATLGNDAGVLGAAWLIKNKLNQ